MIVQDMSEAIRVAKEELAMKLSIAEKVATIYMSHKCAGTDRSEGTLGHAVTVKADPRIMIYNDMVRVCVACPDLVLLVSEGINGYSVSFKGCVATDHDVEEAAFRAIEMGRQTNVTRF